MRRTTQALAITLLAVVGCTTGKPSGDTDADTDNLDDTDVVDTDVADTDVVDTDAVDTDVVDTDTTDTDVADTDTGKLDTDVADTDVIDTDPGDTDVSDTDGALVPHLLSHTLYVNCMPSIPPDPLVGAFVVRYRNDGATASHAALQSSTLTLNYFSLAQATWSFDVTPTDSGSVGAGQQRDVTHAKVARSGSGSTNDLCGYCGGIWSLDVTWLVDGVTVTDSLDAGTVDCVY